MCFGVFFVFLPKDPLPVSFSPTPGHLPGLQHESFRRGTKQNFLKMGILNMRTGVASPAWVLRENSLRPGESESNKGAFLAKEGGLRDAPLDVSSDFH